MSKNKRNAWILTAVCILLAGCGAKGEETPIIQQELILPEEANYTTVQVTDGDFLKPGKGSASVEHPISINLYCEVPNARMQDTLVVKGAEVSKGDPLVLFDLEQYETELKELKLELTRTRQELTTESQRMLQEIELAKSETGWLSVNDAELASLRIQKQQVQYEQYVYQTNRQISMLRDEISELEELAQSNTLTAPYDGVVHSVTSYKEGELINLNKPLVTMYSTEKILLASKDTGKLRYNMPVTITTGTKNNQKVLEGRVVSAPNILPSTVTQDYVLIEVSDDVKEDVFQRGIALTFDMQKLQNILMIDSRAVEKEEGKSFVYILDGDLVKKRFIKTGLNSTESTWVLDGLSADQTLILDY